MFQIKKKMLKIPLLKFCKKIYMAHLLKLFDKMYKNEMDPSRIVGATERTQDAGQTDGRTEWNQNTPQQLICAGGIMISSIKYILFTVIPP